MSDIGKAPSAEPATVRLRPLSLVEEEDEVLVGDPAAGTFVSIPAVGGVVIRALQRGASVEEAEAEAASFTGEPVNVAGFVETLRELGFVDDGAHGAGHDTERTPTRTAPIQNKRWLSGVRQETIRPFFGPVAWTCYALCALFAVATFVAVPDLLPHSTEDPFAFEDIGLSALALVPFGMAGMAIHECGHWLAARAVGIKARFGVDRRIMILVFETDLTQVWAVPRRQRYGPLLAGLAVDCAVLAGLLAVRLVIHTGGWSPPPTVDHLLAAWVFVKLSGLLWQCMVFLRTDLYAVLVNALRCRNLWRVKSLMLRRAFGRLDAAQAAELAEADPADLRAGRWFRWLWLGGFLGVLAWFSVFVVPVAWEVLAWVGDGLAEGPLAFRFWYGLFCAVLLLGPETLAAVLALRQYGRRLVPRRGGSSPAAPPATARD